MKSEELASGICIDCGQGHHQIHCAKTSEPAAEPEEKKEAPRPVAVAEPPAAALLAEPVPAQQAALVPAGQGAPSAPRRTIEATERGLVLASIEDMYRFAKMVVAAGLAPTGLQTPEAVLVAIQFGAEVGLSPMQSLQNVASINGRPSLFGDAPKGIVEASGLLEDSDDWFEHEGAKLPPGQFPNPPDDSTTAFCMVKRVGRNSQTRSFSIADAKRAQLWGKAGPWVTYPQRMLAARARGFALRDVFPDKLKGFRDEHEARDIVDVTPDRPTVEMPRRASEAAVTEEVPVAS
jgi:hypothetical protein